MQRKFKYIILVMLLISALIYKFIAKVTYLTKTSAVNEYLVSNEVQYEKLNKSIEIAGINGKKIVICPDSHIEAKAYLPLANEIVKASGYSVEIIEYGFLGNMDVWFRDSKADLILSHGDGSEYVSKVAKNYQGVILLGSTPYSKLNHDHVMFLKGGLDGVSEINLKTLPSSTITYEIAKANFTNYVYAEMSNKDNPALISQEEQIKQAIEWICDFVVSLED